MIDSQNFLSADFSENSLRLVLASFSGEKIVLKGFAEIPLTPSFFQEDSYLHQKSLAESIEKETEKFKLKNQEVRVIINSSQSYSQVVNLPFLKERELLNAVKYQADRFIPHPLEEIIVDLEIINEDKRNKSITGLIVAAKKKVVTLVKDTVEAAGLIPVVIENEISSAVRFLEKYRIGRFVFNFGYSNSTFFYFDENFILRSLYTFKLGYNVLVKELELAIGVNLNEATDLFKKNSIPYEKLNQILWRTSPFFLELNKEIGLFQKMVLRDFHYQLKEAVVYQAIDDFLPFLSLVNQEQKSVVFRTINWSEIISNQTKESQIKYGHLVSCFGSLI